MKRSALRLYKVNKRESNKRLCSVTHKYTFHAKIFFSFSTHWYHESEVYNSISLLTPIRQCHRCVRLIRKCIRLLLLLLLSLVTGFLPGTFLEPAVTSTAQASSCTLSYFPYYVLCSKNSCLL
jgi:hypothetical protein